ncbi:DUF952 domain-containing protein [Sphingomonas canadensis]|uniref:DUF952 domain-containing protein n=1 Tax=Sphingomonas canadensis TaxID=1219257 RepID=A0ABW3H8B1_9SPHN|nr:DUF952 domain-containing protein [Sphingomonas canadensis]MCW3836868.1 DUF952 domain-containing protein [Sphingomonas canadensis]
MPDPIAYKVLTADQMASLEQDAFTGAPVDIADGYIHLSTAAQLTGTVDRYFAGQEGVWVAAVDLAALGDTVVWEPSRGGALFPHIYGRLPLSAVIARAPLTRETDGSVTLPSP